jgi:hypothetical protein
MTTYLKGKENILSLNLSSVYHEHLYIYQQRGVEPYLTSSSLLFQMMNNILTWMSGTRDESNGF